MNLSMGLTAGFVAGVAGAAAWAAVAMLANLEIGWLAWGIGGLVGWATAAGALYGRSSESESSAGGPALGVVAVVLTILSICAGKYAIVEAELQSMLASIDEQSEAQLAEGFSDETLVSYLADEIGEEQHGEQWQAAYDWPDGVDPSEAMTQADYPAELWSPAQSKWDAMSADEREAYRADTESQYRENLELFAAELAAGARQEGFLATFGAMDLLFFGLAVMTAWGIAGSAEAA